MSSSSFPELQPSARVLLGPGPSNIHPRVMKAMLSPVVGHLDPDFVKVMDDIKKMLRIVFQTTNEDHLSDFGHRLGGDGSRAGESDRRGRRGRDRNGWRIRRASGRTGDAARRTGSSGRRRVGQNCRARANRAGAQNGQGAQAGRDRARRDLDRDPSADRGDREAGACTRRADGRRRSDVARLRTAGDRQLANRCLLQLHAKGYRRPAGTVTGDLEPARDGSYRGSARRRAPRGISTSR